jgi:hypothetical protein
MGIKDLVGKKMTKEVTFMGEKVKVTKLSVDQVTAIQETAKDIETNPDAGFNILKTVIRSAVLDAEDLSDEAFGGFPMDELSNLSQEIMKFSGIAGEKSGK